MWYIVYLLFATAFALLVVGFLRSCRRPVPAKAVRRPARGLAAPPGSRRKHEPIPWDSPIAAPPALADDALSNRLRDRYIAARFPGVATGSQELTEVDKVIRAARLYFEEDAHDQALELLKMAIDQSPASEPLRLAQLEITFLRRKSGRYLAHAREFRKAIPASGNWSEIVRLGRLLAPDETFFADGRGSRPHEQYGPWPDLPNWIQASWDLTAEVLAADFRRAILRQSEQQPPRQRTAIGA